MAKQNAGRKKYTPEDHQRAYEVYFVSRNFSDVQRKCDLSYETVLRWAKANYLCPHGCPWHGWDNKIEEQVRVTAAKQAAPPDPISQAIAVAKAVDAPQELAVVPLDPREIKAALELTTTRMERLYSWRFLYAKLVMELNGLAVDYNTLQGDFVDPKKRLQLEEHYKKGLRPTNLAETIRTLGFVEDRIEKLERELNGEGQITVTPQGVKSSPPTIERPAEAAVLPDNLSLDELRSLSQVAKKLPPRAVKEVLAVMDDEDKKED
jgi:transposase-like protein